MIHENKNQQGGQEVDVRVEAGNSKSGEDIEKSAARIADWLVSSNRNFMFRLKSKLNEHGLSYQNYLLLEDLSTGGPFIMKEIAEKLDVTVAAATGTIDRLTDQAFTRRVPCKEDRRKVVVEITENGREVLTQIHFTIQNQVTSALMASEQGRNDEASQICNDLRELVDVL